MNKKKPSNPRKMDFRLLGRVMKRVFAAYPVLLPLTLFCIVFSAVVASIPSIFTQKVLAVITEYTEAGMMDWSVAKAEILPKVLILVGLYVCSILLAATQGQLMAYITQGFLSKMRRDMFDGMQNLPIKYFDTTKHGDIMSHYTNDIDTLRQLVSQSMPQLLQSCIIVVTVFFIMLYYSVWMTLIILVGVVASPA